MCSCKQCTRKVADYQLLYSDNADRLSKAVNEKLREGYELFGPPAAAHSSSGKYVEKVQAVVIYEDAPDVGIGEVF